MKVIPTGRLQWHVTSESRPDMVHLVDFEPNAYERFIPLTKTKDGKPGWISTTEEEPTFCSCEAFNMLHHRPCKHQREVIRWLVNAIPLTGPQREEMSFQLESLCRQSPHWINPHPEDSEPPKPSSSIKSKREYKITKTHHEHTNPKR